MGQSTNYSRVGHGTGRVEDTQRPSHEFQSGGRERSTLGAQQVSESGGGGKPWGALPLPVLQPL